MLIQFNDLYFENELITLDVEDVVSIIGNPNDNSVIIENSDGLFFNAKIVNFIKE